MPHLVKFNPLRFCDPPAPPAGAVKSRAALIAEHAYYRAERRGFAPGHEVEDWLSAEAEVDAMGGPPEATNP